MENESWPHLEKYLAIRLKSDRVDSLKSSTEVYVERTKTHIMHSLPHGVDVNRHKMVVMSVKKIADNQRKWSPTLQSTSIFRELQFRCVSGHRRAIASFSVYPLDRGSPWDRAETLGLRLKDRDGVEFDVLSSFQPHKNILTGCVVDTRRNESLEDVYWSFIYGE
jgi:hypothetical protein